MSDAERNELLDILEKATKEARSMTPADALQRLVDEGFYTADGKLSVQYGGKAKSAA